MDWNWIERLFKQTTARLASRSVLPVTARLRQVRLDLEALEERDVPSLTTVSNLAGAWNINGLPAEVLQTGPALTFVNATDGRSSGYFVGANVVMAPGWSNLVGTITGSTGDYTISWSNGTAWHEGTAPVPDLAGAWNINGLSTSVKQNGPALTFTNATGATSAGYFVGADEVMATGWNDLIGIVSGTAGNYTITWSNATVWSEGKANIPDLAGAWNDNGLATSIGQSGPDLHFTNAAGATSSGYFVDPGEVIATGWGNLIGAVSGGRGAYTISWINGTTWQEGSAQLPSLGGAWIMNGLPTEIEQNGPELSFINGVGMSSAGSFVSSNQVTATGWGNLLGTISGSAGSYMITWANGTVWQQGSASVPSLGGTWNINGLATEVQQFGPVLYFTNAADAMSAGNFISSNQVVATGWGNLIGTISGSAGSYTITWANGTSWQQGNANLPNLVGTWDINGLPTQVEQFGPTLYFTNETGGTSAGYFTSSTQVVATGWGSLTGAISGTAGNYVITWSNGTVWNEDETA